MPQLPPITGDAAHQEASFTLDRRLEEDTFDMGRLGLCAVRLMNDRRFPWLILVPERSGARELFALPRESRDALMEEIAVVSAAMADLFAPDKLNIAALGNVVEQLHVHVVARYRTDVAWPGPVWGNGQAEPYAPEQWQVLAARIKQRLAPALRP